jgi:DNA-binding MarR family transcriptional regulator
MIQAMSAQARPGTRNGAERAGDDDALGVIETEIAVLARALEGMHRRSELYRDLDRASYLIARTLETTGAISINGLAAVLGVDATTITRQVATMESAHLLVRRADPNDGRVSLISLSPHGRKAMRTVQVARKKRIATLLADWTPGDRHDLGRLLAKFNRELNHGIERPA